MCTRGCTVEKPIEANWFGDRGWLGWPQVGAAAWRVAWLVLLGCTRPCQRAIRGPREASLGSGLVMAPYPNRLGLRQGCDAWRDCPPEAFHTCVLPWCKCMPVWCCKWWAKRSKSGLIRVWRGRNINVIEECCCSFSWKQVALEGAEGKVQPPTRKGPASGGSACSPPSTSLCDATHLAGVVRPRICGRLAVETGGRKVALLARWVC